MRSVDLESFPVGFRFHPTDEELVNHYLKSKTFGLDSKVSVIPEVDICKCEPWDLPDIFLRRFHNTFPNCSEIQANDNRWYFFCRRDVKNRVNRLTEAGFWKLTGEDRIIKSRDTDTSIGIKKTLVFLTGRTRNSKGTNWVIHEYHLTPNPLHCPKTGFVLCLLKKKNKKNKNKNDNTCGEVEPSSASGSSPSVNFTVPIPNNSSHTNQLLFNVEPSSVSRSSPDVTNHWLFNGLVSASSPSDNFTVPRPNNSRHTNFWPFNVELSSTSRSSPDDNFTVPIPNNSRQTNHWPFNVGDLVSDDSVEELALEDQAYLWQLMHPEQLINNDHEEMQMQSNAMESIDEDIGQYMLSEDEYTLAESRGHRAMAARRSEMPETHLVRVSSDCSLTKEYVKDSESSSDTDTELVLQSRVDPIVKIIRSLNMQCRRENFGFLDNESGGSSPSSINSIADKPTESNCHQSTSPEFPVNITRTSRAQYELRSHNFVAQGTAPGKLCVQEVLHEEPKQGKVSESSCITVKHEGRPDSVKARETATKLPQKEKSIVVSNNDLGMAGGGGAKKLSLKPREQEESSGKNQKCGSNFVETSLASSHGSSPPSDCPFNLLLGIILLGLFFSFVVLDMNHRISSVFN